MTSRHTKTPRDRHGQPSGRGGARHGTGAACPACPACRARSPAIAAPRAAQSGARAGALPEPRRGALGALIRRQSLCSESKRVGSLCRVERRTVPGLAGVAGSSGASQGRGPSPEGGGGGGGAAALAHAPSRQPYEPFAGGSAVLDGLGLVLGRTAPHGRRAARTHYRATLHAATPRRRRATRYAGEASEYSAACVDAEPQVTETAAAPRWLSALAC